MNERLEGEPNVQEIKQAAQILHRFESGFLPYPLFKEGCRLFRLPKVEIVPGQLENIRRAFKAFENPANVRVEISTNSELISYQRGSK